MQTYAGYLYIFIAATCWGFLGIFGNIAMQSGLSPIDVAFWRAFLGGIFLYAHAIAKKQARIQFGKDLLIFTLFGACSIASFFAAYQYAVKDGGAALASVLLYTAPAWVAIFSRIFFNLPLTKMTCIAIFVALIGCSLISFSPLLGSDAPVIADANPITTLSIMGIIFGLLSGFLYATQYVMARVYLVRYSAFTLYGYGSLVAAACLFPFVNISFDMAALTWFAIISIGFICTYLAYWTYCESIKRLHPTKVAVLATLEPVVATIAAWCIWGESFTLLGWIGAGLILSTVIMFLVDDKNKSA